MPIMRDGVDVTDETMVVVAAKQVIERRCGYGLATYYLEMAKKELDRTPRPWQNDCVWDGIQAIDKIIASLGVE